MERRLRTTLAIVPDRSYLICSVSRGGSGLLAKLLRGTEIAGRPDEYFWRGDEPPWRERWGTTTAKDYVAAALAEGSTPNGVFGARVMWGYVDDVVAKLASIGVERIEGRHEVLAAALPGSGNSECNRGECGESYHQHRRSSSCSLHSHPSSHRLVPSCPAPYRGGAQLPAIPLSGHVKYAADSAPARPD